MWGIVPHGILSRAPKLSRSSWTRSVRAEGCCKIRSRSPSASTRPVRVRPLQPGAARVALLQGCSVVIICNTTAQHAPRRSQHACTPPLATCEKPAHAARSSAACSNRRVRQERLWLRGDDGREGGGPCSICAGIRHIPATSAPGLGSPRPHLHTETGLTPATSAPGPGSPLPHLRRDWAHPRHICAGTGLTPEQGSPRDQARHRHICAGTRLISAAQCCSLQGKAIEVGSALKSGADTLGSVFTPAT